MDTNDIPISLTERIRADQITITSKRMPYGPTWARDRAGHAWYRVQLSYAGQVMKVPAFGMGPALDRQPTAYDVLACLTADAAGYDNAQGFDEWVADLGYEDKAHAMRLYALTGEQTIALRAFLGESYDAYLYETADS